MKSSYTYKCEDGSVAILQHTNYHNNGRIITNIQVPSKFRNKGIGTKLLEEICQDADKDKVVLWLEIQYRGGLSSSQLAIWYKKFRFRDLGGIYARPFKK